MTGAFSIHFQSRSAARIVAFICGGQLRLAIAKSFSSIDFLIH
ncbi:hypothetical protein [Erwinia persicina]|nr:hypothetical protein [Erwinia persicina]